MREDGLDQFRFGGFQRFADNKALNELRYLGAAHMCAEKFASLGIKHRLDQSFRLAERAVMESTLPDPRSVDQSQVSTSPSKVRIAPPCQPSSIDTGVPVPVLSAALYARFDSRGESEFANKLLSALRMQFGGHQEPGR